MAKVSANRSVPAWLWRSANWSLALVLVGIAALASALALGAADLPRAGPLLWEDDFKAGLDRWLWPAIGPQHISAAEGALRVELAGNDGLAWAIAPGIPGSLTLEVAGASADNSAAYGLVFGWQDETHYSAVLVNGNGYTEAYTLVGDSRTTWWAWQQWPHILGGGESNRVRVDVRAAGAGWDVVARINDEVLAKTTLAGGAGQVGVIARSPQPARVVFSWVKLWGTP
jgi:hypothetical protein